MPPETKKLQIGIGVNTVVTTLLGTLVSFLLWANHQQLDTISLKQDKAILQVQTDSDNKYELQTKHDSDISRLAVWIQNNAKKIEDDTAASSVKMDALATKLDAYHTEMMTSAQQTALAVQVLTDTVNNKPTIINNTTHQ